MVTQLLFGEHFAILETHTDGWSRIRNAADQYEGWVNNRQFRLISKKTFDMLGRNATVLAGDLQEALSIKKEKTTFPVLMGSVLPGCERGKFIIEGTEYFYHGETVKAGVKPDRKKIVHTAMLFLHAPYLWGGKSEFGIDCSGFTQVVFRVNGIRLPRDAYQQADMGETLNFVEEAQPGDLAFFDNAAGKITHVGILTDSRHIIHASGMVRLDPFDLHGIYNAEKKSYSHNLRLIKRVIR